MAVVVKSIERKRSDGFVRIAQNMLGTSLAAAVPTPALELTKNIGIAAADAWMFYDIYKIYYDERLSAQKLKELLGNAGVIIFTGGVVSYGALKVSQGLISEFLNAIPVIGWVASGAMTGASTFTLGLAWLAFVEAQYRLSVEADDSPPIKASSGKKRVVIRNAADSPAEAVKTEAERVIDDLADDAAAMVGTVRDEIDSVVADLKALADEFGIVPDEDGKVQTLHPEGKQSFRVDFELYIRTRRAVTQALDAAGGEMVLQELYDAVEAILGPDFEASVKWYVNTIKVDLEARGIIERVPNKSPQRVRLVS